MQSYDYTTGKWTPYLCCSQAVGLSTARRLLGNTPGEPPSSCDGRYSLSATCLARNGTVNRCENRHCPEHRRLFTLSTDEPWKRSFGI